MRLAEPAADGRLRPKRGDALAVEGHGGGACRGERDHCKGDHALRNPRQAALLEARRPARVGAAACVAERGEIGDFGRAAWPHGSLRLGPTRLRGSSQVCSAARNPESQLQEAREVSSALPWRTLVTMLPCCEGHVRVRGRRPPASPRLRRRWRVWRGRAAGGRTATRRSHPRHRSIVACRSARRHSLAVSTRALRLSAPSRAPG